MVRLLTSVSLLATVVSVSAQSSNSAVTTFDVPCAQTCLTQYFGNDVNYGCAADDVACSCNSVDGFKDLFCCIATVCDASDIALAASNAFSLCGQYNAVPTIPDASQCPGLSVTSSIDSSSPTATPTSTSSSSSTSTTSTSTSAPKDESSSKSKGGLSTGAKAGIGAGAGAIVVALIVGAVLFFFCRRRSKNTSHASPEMQLSKDHPTIQDPYHQAETPAPAYNQFELDNTTAEKSMGVQSHELEVGDGKHELDVSDAAKSPAPQSVLSHELAVSDASYASPKSSISPGVGTTDSRFTNTQSNGASYELE